MGKLMKENKTEGVDVVQLQVSATLWDWRMWVIAREVDGRQNADKTEEVDD